MLRKMWNRFSKDFQFAKLDKFLIISKFFRTKFEKVRKVRKPDNEVFEKYSIFLKCQKSPNFSDAAFAEMQKFDVVRSGCRFSILEIWVLEIKIRVSELRNLYFSMLRLFEKWCQWADVQIAKIPRMRRIKKSSKFENMQILRNRRIRKPETTRILRFLKHEKNLNWNVWLEMDLYKILSWMFDNLKLRKDESSKDCKNLRNLIDVLRFEEGFCKSIQKSNWKI